MPIEEELDLSGDAPIAKTEGDAAAEPLIKAHPGIINITPGATNKDILAAVLAANDSSLIPWELAELPSKGKFYKDGAGNPWPDGMIKIKAMNQAAEKALANQRLVESGQAIDRVFRECCGFPDGFDPIDLLVGDRMFILYYLRGITHGNEYEFLSTCPACEGQSTYNYDLNLLIGTVKTPGPNIGTEPFRVVLPYMSEVVGQQFWVEVRFLRGSDNNDMIAKRKAKLKAAGGMVKPGLAHQRSVKNVQNDDVLTEHLQTVIVGAMGDNNPFVIKSLIGKLHARDTATIREWLKQNTPGIDSTVAMTCPSCQHEFTIELPITDSFFRPKVGS